MKQRPGESGKMTMANDRGQKVHRSEREELMDGEWEATGHRRPATLSWNDKWVTTTGVVHRNEGTNLAENGSSGDEALARCRSSPELAIGHSNPGETRSKT